MNFRIPSLSCPTRRNRGSALVSTLLVIVVLSVIVVAFLQSMTLERQTAASYLTRYQAQLGADAGLDFARNQIYRTISDDANKADPQLYNRKVNFVTWAYSPDATKFAPYYTGILSNAIPQTPNAPGSAAVGNVTQTVWLASDPANANNATTSNSSASATDPNRFATSTSSIPVADRCNVNFKLSVKGTAPRYWIDQSGTPYYVGWVDLPASNSTATDLKVRYAYWVDDEMGRADLGKLGNSGQALATASVYRGLPGDLVINNSSGNGTVANRKYFTDADMSAITTARDTAEPLGTTGTKINPLTISPGAIKQYVSQPARDRLAKDTLSYTVRDEAALQQPASSAPSVFDLIPYGPFAGYQKRNLNTLVAQAVTPAIRVQQIHDLIALALPEYFRRKNSPPGTVMRIAASIHDYIDPAKYPTLAPSFDNSMTTFINQVDKFVKGTGPRPPFPAPTWDTLDLNNRWYGVKGAPYINAIDFSSTPIPSSSGSTSTFTPTYGFYLWNPNETPYSLTGVELLVFNTGFGPANGATAGGRPVDGLPYFRYDIIPVPVGTQSLASRELRLVNFTKTYTIDKNVTKSTITGGNNWGFVLFLRETNGSVHVLDGYKTTTTFNFASTSAGGEATGSAANSYYDVKDRRQTLSLREGAWLSARTPVQSTGVGGLASFQLLARWYDQPFPITPGSSLPPLFSVPGAPMRSLGELGNVFDPVNDLGVNAPGNPIPPTPGELNESNVTFSGTNVSRGGKTLNVGQFDDFFDDYQTGATGGGNVNPMANVAAGWSSYEKYLRFADTALFDIFTLKTPAESRASRPLNLNAPRPFDVGSSSPDTGALSPLSSYLEGARALLPLKPPGNGYNYANLIDLTTLQTAGRERLSGPDWKLCRPYRNMSDLVLTGIPKADLARNLRLTRKDGSTAISSLFTSNSNQSSRAIIAKANVNVVTLSQGFSGPNSQPRNISVIGATNKDRQAPFGRIADQATLRSYRYRIHVVGQVYRPGKAGQPNIPISTVYQSYIYDLNPTYDPSSEPALPALPNGPAPQPAAPPDVVLNPKLQRVINE